MDQKTRDSLRLLAAAGMLGILGDMLFHGAALGINVFIGVICLAVASFVISRKIGVVFQGDGRLFVIPAILFAGAIAWRDSRILNELDMAMLLISLALIAAYSRNGQAMRAGVLRYLRDIIQCFVRRMAGPRQLLKNDIQWSYINQSHKTRETAAVVRGLLLAVPILIIFGSLLMSADSVFNHLVQHFFNWDFSAIFSHLGLMILIFWLSAGYLYQLILAPLDTSEIQEKAKPILLGTTETGVALGLLNLLFFLFVLVQIRYFFGGQQHVNETIGLTYAEYARSGFFELVTVAILVLPLLLVWHQFLNTTSIHTLRLFRALAVIQIALLFVIMASAVGRMQLYQSEYGATELRFYTMAFMGWLAVVFLWFVGTVLQGKRERFTSGALAAGFILIIFLHVLNPDVSIVRTNIALAHRGHKFDIDYAASLSADAAPALIAALATLNPTDQTALSAQLARSPYRHDCNGWRAWNWSRMTAQKYLTKPIL